MPVRHVQEAIRHFPGLILHFRSAFRHFRGLIRHFRENRHLNDKRTEGHLGLPSFCCSLVSDIADDDGAGLGLALDAERRKVRIAAFFAEPDGFLEQLLLLFRSGDILHADVHAPEV